MIDPSKLPEMMRDHNEADITDAFNTLYYDKEPWKETRWRGVRVLKNPCDLWTYQELIHKVRPRIIIETGTAYGGSALFFADMMNLYGPCHVITIDVEYRNPPDDPRLTCLGGSSTDDEVVNWIKNYLHEHPEQTPVMVTLDSDHSDGHVIVELVNYGVFVTPGSYMVVEDTNTTGVQTALDRYLRNAAPATGMKWRPDPDCERHLLTFNRGGWLERLP